jgi:phosphoribosylanthranilate isomerase
MIVKICGLNPTRDVQLCIDLNVNFLGFIFYKKSPRNIDLDDVKILSKYNKKNSSFVAVTVNPTNEFIEKTVLNNFDYIQLHGSETRKRINEIKKYNLKIIKAIKIKEEADINKYKEFNEADIILFDTPGMEKSIKFPKDLIAKLPKGKKFALAGSISEDNIKNIANLGVNFFDLSSNLEKQVGYKDHLKIKSFMNNIKKINEV